MRKTLIDPAAVNSEQRTEQEWLDLEEMVRIAEVTSEDPSFPLESALVSGAGPGWRAAQTGKQIIRILFDSPARLRRIRLEFSETEIARTQEFTLLVGPRGERSINRDRSAAMEFQSARLDQRNRRLSGRFRRRFSLRIGS